MPRSETLLQNTLAPLDIPEQIFLDTKLNLLLVFFPLAVAARVLGWGEGLLFSFSCLALVPLAEVRRAGHVCTQALAGGARGLALRRLALP